MDTLLARLLSAQLRSVGWLAGSGTTDVTALKATKRMPPHVERWLDASLVILDRHGLVRYEPSAGKCTVLGTPEPARDAWRAWEEARGNLMRDLSLRPRLVIAETMMRALPEVLRGEKLTTDVLFPNGSYELVRAVYQGNPLADLLNRVMAEAAAAYVRRRVADDPAARIHILEVGAGTGSTSRLVFPALEPFRDAIDEYAFTDLSKAFLFAAEEEFGPAVPYLAPRILDIEQPPTAQGFTAGRYDLVLATNVLHATRRMRDTIGHVRSLLRPGGLVLLNELAGNAMSLHIAFGLLEGWWLHEDPELRIPGSPGLNPETWQLLLEEAGFGSVLLPMRETHAAGGQIVIAENAPAASGTAPAEKPAASRQSAVRVILRDELARVLRTTPEALHGTVALRDYGLDSILGIEFVRRASDLFGIDLATTVLFEHGSLDSLAQHITESGGAPPVAVTSPVAVPPPVEDAVAIVGVSGRFAGSRSVDEFWSRLAAGEDLVGPVDRWDLPDDVACRRGSFIPGFDEFDALFFNVSGLEAELMDPQQRVFLEESFLALEQAGLVGPGVSGSRVGVYVGCTGGDYHLLQEDRAIAPQGMSGRAGSILAARISYLLNLRGPAIAIDTACSSSLVGVHLGVQALRGGQIDVAVAGGVFVLSTPEFYLSAGAAGMLSPSGRCAAFSAGADGFVPGEGAAAVVLKRLPDAMADGDVIYGVIRGSGLNQDGASNGITAPSVGAQEALLRSVYEESGIRPGEVQVLEAHGTGTALGDPVEFAALARVFGAEPEGPGRCALGTVKTNIGHTAAAAGVAGMVKLLWGMRNGLIPPVLHFAGPNPEIVLDGSPFSVNTTAQPWPADANGRRIAAVSAFGFSGTNAHLVLTGGVDVPPPPAIGGGWPVVVSAPTRAQLVAQVRRLADWCASHEAGRVRFADVSHTLTLGRRHHRGHRLACTAQDVIELAGLLDRWLDDGQEPGFIGATDGRGVPLANAFVQGEDVDFEPLFAAGGFRRLPLPASVFARRRYWTGVQPQLLTRKQDRLPALHPLVHRNTSTLREHRYSTTLTGDEFFLADHVVGGVRIVPGVVSLEMARAAAGLAGEAPAETVRLANVAWPRPIRWDGRPCEVHVTLTPGKGDRVRFTVHGGQDEVYCQGDVEFRAGGDDDRLDLARLRRECGTRVFAAEDCYAVLRAAGVEHGPRLRALTDLGLGDGQALARIDRPDGAPTGAYWLHPSLLDAALQTVVPLSRDTANADGVLVPFTVDSVESPRPVPARAWVHTTVAAREATSHDAASFDIVICDEDGVVAARLRGLAGRRLGPPGAMTSGRVEPAGAATPYGPAGLRAAGEPVASGDPVFVVPEWEPVPEAELSGGVGADVTGPVVVLGEVGTARDRLVEVFGGVGSVNPGPAGLASAGHLVWLAPSSSSDVVADQEHGVLGLFGVVKGLLDGGAGDRSLALTVVTTGCVSVRGERVVPAHAGVHGLVGSLAQEFPHWRVRLLDLSVEPGGWPEGPALTAVAADWQGLAYRDGGWYRRRLLPGTVPAGAAGFRPGGVYVVVGGTGGVGVAFSEYVARVYGARLVWLGRRERNAAIDELLDRVGRVGPRPVYLSADVTDRGAVERALGEVMARFGVVHGVVHSALELADRGLAGMDVADFRRTYDAKVAGTVWLLEVFGALESLELVVMFSSLNAFLRAPGQSNYVAGCVFQDAYAQWWGAGRDCAVKVMYWGWWGSVGAVAGAGFRERMGRVGLGSIEGVDGMAALESLVAAPVNRLGYLRVHGQVDLAGETVVPIPVATLAPAPTLPTPVRELAAARHARSPLPAVWSVPGAGSDTRAVRGLVAEVLGVDPGTVEIGVALEEYGWDAAAAAHLRALLTDRLGETVGLAPLMAAGTVAELADLTGATASDSVDDLLVALLWTQIRAIGWFAGRAIDRDVIAGRLTQRLPAWLDETLRILTEYGYLSHDGTVLRPPPPDAWARWDAAAVAWRADPDLRAQTVLVDTVLRALPDVLSGRRLATEVMFPGSSMDLVQGLYQGNALADFFNGVLADALVEYVRARVAAGDGDLRILEVGSGTGGTSSMIFDRLGPWQEAIAEYRYTDVSEAFLSHAEETYRARAPYLTLGLLDIERSPVGQRLPLGGFDVVVAANVLHATSRMHRTMRHVKALLRPGGLLLVNELTRHQMWAHVTFGLLPGWWLAEDPGLRLTGSPALGTAQWRRVLTDVGFTGIAFPLDESRDPQQHIILAESDGVIALEATGEASTPAPAAPPVSARPAAVPPVEPVTRPDAVGLVEFAEQRLREVFASVLRLEAADIDPRMPFETYGIDSIVVVQLAAALRETFEDVTAATLFEHRDLHALATALARDEPAAVRGLLGIAEAAPVPPGASGDIAIVGVAGRYPQAGDLDEFWRNLRDGRDSVTEIPSGRWDHRVYGAGAPVRGGFLDGVDEFDPLFFNIAPADAELLDPQERLFLQCAYATLEDAGYTRARAAATGPVGVFVGAMYQEYQLYGAEEQMHGRPVAMAGSAASIANRVSFFCGFEGPSIAIDTMCSSSLTAIHLACESLRRGEASMALAGGVNVSVHPNKYLMLGQGNFLSSEGRCASFGAGGDGFVPAEGVGAVLLKPLAAALADGDRIWGVVKASAIAHGGRSNGYTVPNPKAQGDVVARAWSAAGIEPGSVGYVEAHGTGTSLGDPIEIAGLARVFDGAAGEVPIGSVKSNIGHAESAAGIAGLTKVLLQMRHGQLAPSLHAEVPNPHIDFERSVFRVQRELAPWPRTTGRPRRAGVSSFGAGGANAHLVIEEPPVQPEAPGWRPSGPAVVVLSAADEDRLRDAVCRLADFTGTDLDVHRAAYTLQTGREAMACRVAFRVTDAADLRRQLRSYLDGDHRVPADLAGWVDGGEADWGRLYPKGRPLPLSLPAYPFARERYWIPAGVVAPRAETPPAAGRGRRPGMHGLTVERCLVHDLKENLGALIKMSPDRVDAGTSLADYGVDSIRIPRLAARLTDHLGIDLTPATLYSYPTVAGLAGYYLAEHEATVRAFYDGEPAAAAVPAPARRPSTVPATVVPRRRDDDLIAVIGMSGRFPGARDVDELWDLLATGKDAVTPVGPDRIPGPWSGGWAPGVYEFDPEFFAISPAEAELMDPRQRLLLQEAWRALEDAGYGGEQLAPAKVGMFVGVERGDYPLETGGGGMLLSDHEGVLAARLAYFLDLDGPNMAINTACSSGLVSTHQACQSLRSGECDTAVAAGVTLLLHPDSLGGMHRAGLLSPDQRCYAFDKRANGMVPAEAVAVVVLKRLSDAVADGDPIHAVIRGSGINYDGRTNGIAAPSGAAQAKLFGEVYDRYRVDPGDIGYVVAHGTGTRLGDPIEVNALSEVFRKRTGKRGYCALTSTKTNLGHSFAASGVVSLISLVQALRHRRIPGSLHFEQENDFIEWADSPFVVNRETRPWTSDGDRPLMGAVSAFGISGTNAHVVVEEYRPAAPAVPAPPAPYHLLLLSAQSEESLRERVEDLAGYLERAGTTELADVAYTLMAGRRHFRHRLAVVVREHEDAVAGLRRAAAGADPAAGFRGQAPREFTGQPALRRYAEELIAAGPSTDPQDCLESLQALADLYCLGYDLPWTRWAGGRRLHLPGYPFRREQYRISAAGAAPKAPAASSMPGLRRRLAARPRELPLTAAANGHART
jgi:acyl transferase domain-containing protein/aryl carrier-like protein/SAM-dependent methyltransferase